LNFRKAAATMIIGISILNGVGRGLKELWVFSTAERLPRERFLDEARSRIPDSASVCLVLAGHVDYYITTVFYPRPVEIVPNDQYQRLSTERPNAWVVVFPSPFLREKAFVGQARDLH
jgi:hypothetical protein